MPNEGVRKLLLRVLFDDDFHQLVLTHPEKAFAGYDLSEQEKKELTRPGKSFYALLAPSGQLSFEGNFGIRTSPFDQPPVTVTVNTNTVNTVTTTVNTVSTTVNVVTVTTTTSSAFNPYNFLVNEALRLAGQSIVEEGAKDRFGRILELLELMSGERR